MGNFRTGTVKGLGALVTGKINAQQFFSGIKNSFVGMGKAITNFDLAARDPYAYGKSIGGITGGFEAGIAMAAVGGYVMENFISPALSDGMSWVSEKASGAVSAATERLASEGGFISLGGGGAAEGAAMEAGGAGAAEGAAMEAGGAGAAEGAAMEAGGAGAAAESVETLSTQSQLEGIAVKVNEEIPGNGSVVGTKKHTLFEQEVKALGNDNLATERSFLNGAVVDRGTPGSIRCDVVEYDGNGNISNIYDLKTGSARLTPKRIAQIQSHLPKGSNMSVIEIR